jgi:hypothetical protein
MNRTLSFVLSGVVAGALAGVAVGYWEARPWVVGVRTAPAANGGAGQSAPVADAPIAPNAVVPETIFRFGNMESGDTQNHDFHVRNEGTGPLTIDYVSHTCKCTEVRLNDEPSEPGAAIVVDAGKEAVITLQWAAKVPPGPFRHGATFTTNDAELKRVELTVEGEIVESATLSPAELAFGPVRVGEQGRAELIVMSFLEPEVQILSHEVFDAELAKRVHIAIEPVPVDKLPNEQAKAGVRVIATYDPGDTAGPFVGSLRIETNLEKSPANSEAVTAGTAAEASKFREVPIYGTVKGDVWIHGPLWSEDGGLLRMMPFKSADGGKAKLYVNIRGEHAADTEVRLDDGSVTPPELKATLGEREKIRDGLERIPLLIEIPAGTRPMVRAGEDQGGEGEIILSTTHPRTAKLRVRIHFTVQP